MTTAVVVGSGPNGLTGAAVLARAGLDVTVLEAADEPGGGTRSAPLTRPGLLHDLCSAVHPLAVASPALRSLGLDRFGLTWRHPEVPLAHPLDGGRVAVLHRSLEATATGLGPDGPAWARTFGPLATRLDDLVGDALGPLLRWPRHPIAMARLGLRAALPTTVLARRFRTEEARALFGGVAAHLVHELDTPLSASVGVLLVAAAHRYGWPVAEGGSRSIADALVALLEQHGGRVVTGRRVDRYEELDGPDVVLLDTSPRAAARILGDRLPRRVRRAYAAYRHGPAAFKVDLAVEGGLPWADPWSGRAGTVHLGGTLEEIVAVEREVARGRMPARPFVLVGQQYLADPSRSAGDCHPVWAYAHVPHGWTGDATDAVLDQIERFAPGARRRIVEVVTRGPRATEAANEAFVGGDILGGQNRPWQLVARPRLSPWPYRTGVHGVYLCSAATPPGAGVHGMAGYHAARLALAEATQAA